MRRDGGILVFFLFRNQNILSIIMSNDSRMFYLFSALCLERVTDRPWHICASSGATGVGLAEGVTWLARQLRQAHTKQ